MPQETGQPTPKVLLKELRELQHVNAIIPRQSLKFGPDGVTIIYGENGAGKSGYARVLKHACHAREKNEPIHPNISVPRPRAPAQAVFELLVDGKDHTETWVHGGQQSELLAQIAVFDSRCARVFLDEANEVVYIPYGMDVFGRLAALCRSLRSRAEQALKMIPPASPLLGGFSETTTAGSVVRNLSRHTNDNDLAAVTALSHPETQRVTELEEMLLVARTTGPKARAQQLRRLKQRLERLAAILAVVHSALSAEKEEELRVRRRAAESSVQAAHVASTEAFREEPLAGVGSDPWRELFLAARRYSEELAYPGEQFPVIRLGSVCVLCQQSLDDEASARLERFRDFIQQDMMRAKDQKVAEYNFSRQMWATVNLRFAEVDSTLIEELRALSEDSARSVEEYVAVATRRQSGVLTACEADAWEGIPALPDNPCDQLAALVALLESQASEFEMAEDAAERQKRQQELLELRERKHFNDNIAVIRERVSLLRYAHALGQCIDATDTQGITRAGSQLMEQVVTEQLKNSLKHELDALGVSCCNVVLKTSGEYGKTKHQLFFTTNVYGRVDPSGILSEGEQRVVAIASFLAELAVHETHCGMVLDDPVSSLDHRFREKVAERLVLLSFAKRSDKPAT